MQTTNNPLLPFPVIALPNATLLQLTLEDAPVFFELRCNTDVNKYTGISKPASIAEVEIFITKLNNNIETQTSIIWKIVLPETTTLIGTICLWNFNKANNSAEIGFVLMPQFWRQGIMFNAVNAVIKFGFDVLDFQTIEGWTHQQNIGAINLLIHSGFSRDYALENAAQFTPEEKDMCIYTLNRNN